MFRHLFGGALMLLSAFAQAQTLQPFVLAYTSQQSLPAETDKVRAALQATDLKVIGEYAPWEGAHVLAVSSDEMLANAAQSNSGGFGAANHVALTQVGESVQVSYLNPAYTAAAYRMKSVPSVSAGSLKSALGESKTFGTADGRSDADLREFHYMMGMEYFDDPYKLATHKSHAAALKAVEENLAKNVGGSAQVYRLEIPGTEQVLFGVSRANVDDKRANDAHILRDTVDEAADLKTTAYLPYQLLVDGNKVSALHMRFRMSVYHPDLTMGTFGKLMSSPGAIEDLLRKVAGGEKKSRFF